MQNKFMLDVDDVAKLLGISGSHAYRIIKDLNTELKQNGYLTVKGKISTNYFASKFFGDATSQIGGIINAGL